MNSRILSSVLLVLISAPIFAQQQRDATPETPCTFCEEWNKPHRPFQIYGNTYYVGTDGLSSILITSTKGHVLIDGALPESVPLIEKNIRDLGFEVKDIKLILNSHAHYDHAGGIAELQKASGARVAASPASASVLEQGNSQTDDPQFGELFPFPPVSKAHRITDGEKLRVGTTELTAHFTPGHTRGGTTWSWRSCEREKCLNMVYADSLTPVSAEGFMFSDNQSYPTVVNDFRHSFTLLEKMPCDILVAAHPFAADLWQRLQVKEQGKADALVDSTACSRYAAAARSRLEKRLEMEKDGDKPKADIH